MNFNAAIKKLISDILRMRNLSGLNEIVRHIERAQELYLEGTKRDVDEYFTDVILRNNLAFEAILREAYTLYSEKEKPSYNSLNDIENFFLTNQILSKRIMEEFRNYRQKWRNLSTHSYTTYFDEHDALFSIISILGFSSILLSEIHRKIRYDFELEQAKDIEVTVDSNIPLIDFVTGAFILWAETIDHKETFELKEIEVAASIEAFLKVHLPDDVSIEHDYTLDRFNIVDLMLKRGEENLAIEIKRGHYIDMGTKQLLNYMQALPNTNGILFLYLPGFENDFESDTRTYIINNERRQLHVIHPSSMDPDPI